MSAGEEKAAALAGAGEDAVFVVSSVKRDLRSIEDSLALALSHFAQTQHTHS